jgi:hypothetical protein
LTREFRRFTWRELLRRNTCSKDLS